MVGSLTEDLRREELRKSGDLGNQRAGEGPSEGLLTVDINGLEGQLGGEVFKDGKN